VFRIATHSDLDAILAVEQTDLVSPLDPARVSEDFSLRRHRPEWSWLAEEGGRLAAFALWWGLTDSTEPNVLSHLWVSPADSDPSALAGALLRTAVQQLRLDGLTSVPEVELDLPGAWRSDAATSAAVEWRQVACRAISVTEWNERRQQEWTDDRPVPQRSGRLEFAPGSDDEFLDVFRRVAVGSLDVLTRQTLAELGPDGQAQDDLDFYRSLPGDRALWRIATDRTSAVVGFAIPSRSAYDASVSYLGVVPEHRGHHYVDDLLAEITRLHAESGAVRITGTTDSTNRPMLAAFARAGYTVTGTRLVGTAPAGHD
jgi:ribosomal protein S18 acetylase RimI-like enzyme